MKRFVFKYSTVETLRKTKEELALKEFSIQQRQYRFEVEMRNKMMIELQTAFQRREELSSLSAPISSLVTEDHFIEGQKIRIQQQDKTIQKAHKKLQQALAHYRIERKKLKTIEKLRERDHEQYKKTRSKFEQNQIEDLLIMRARFQEEESA